MRVRVLNISVAARAAIWEQWLVDWPSGQSADRFALGGKEEEPAGPPPGGLFFRPQTALGELRAATLETIVDSGKLDDVLPLTPAPMPLSIPLIVLKTTLRVVRRRLFNALIGLALVGAGVGASGSPGAADLGHVLIQGLSKAVDLLPGSAASALPAATGNLSACRQHLWKGEAPSLQDSASHNLQPLCFDAFAVGYSPATKTPIWAAQRLTRGQLESARGVHRPDAGEGNADPFFADPRLPSRWQAGPRDFRGFDRGHLAPAGDQPNAGAMAQSFSLANIVPQDSTMNRQAWAKVEADTRRYVRRAKGAVFVVTGAVFASPPARLLSGVAIPSHLFKAVLDETSGRSWAFLMSNDATAVVQPPISLQELRTRTGVQAFAGLGQPK